MKNKTLATWLAFLGGPLGLHRFYLRGFGDWLGWLLPLPTLAGIYGISRIRQYGLDDVLSWWLVPLLGINIAACALVAIVYGLKTRAEWNATFNPGLDPEHVEGATNWYTIAAIVLSLMVGTACLMASIAYSFQRYFEYQVEEGRKISE